ncbi:MAG: ABA4-like family protein [Verrucomicrobiota bacterium]
MTPENLFSGANTLALLAWLALMVRPGSPWVLRFAGRWVPLAFALAYAVILGCRIGRLEGGFHSLAAVASLFRDPWVLLAGWLHYLAFDLWVGAWEARDAADRRLPQGMLVPCLLLTFLFGPAGWLLYQGVRAWRPPPPAPTCSGPPR